MRNEEKNFEKIDNIIKKVKKNQFHLLLFLKKNSLKKTIKVMILKRKS